jgi:hypothetical protein
MNRNLLLIAIAAVAVVGIAAGVLLLGNGQTGPLSGALGPITTNLTLTVSDCADADASGNRGFAIFGVLRDSAGNGLADKTIALRTAKCDNGTCGVLGVEFGTTDPMGGFSFVKSEPATPNLDADTYIYYGAAFSGDEKYAGCASGTVKKRC